MTKIKYLITLALFLIVFVHAFAQVKQEEIKKAINETAFYVANVLLDEEGKSRCDYNIIESKWYPYEVPWHTGQAIYALLAAYKQTGNKAYLNAAKKSGEYWIGLQIKDHSKLRGMIRAVHGDFIGDDFIVFSTVSDGTPGIYELSRVTKDPKYATAATQAAAWMLANMCDLKQGVCYDNVDAKTGEVLKEYSPFWKSKDSDEQKLFDVSRPNTEGSLFKDAYEFSGDKKFKEAFISLCNSLVTLQGSEGVWMQFMPNSVAGNYFHPRFSLWYAESLIQAFKLTNDRKYLEAAAKTARVFMKAQLSNGTIFYENYLDERAPDKGSVTGSSVALAGIVWIGLAREGYTEFNPAIERSARWLVDNRFAQNHPDTNLRGAVLETRTRMKKTKVWITNRDVGTTFAVRFLSDYYDFKFQK